MRQGWPGALVISLLIGMPRPAGAADVDVRALSVQVEVEARLLGHAGQRWGELLESERRAAVAVQEAAGQLAVTLVQPAAVPEPGSEVVSREVARARLARAEDDLAAAATAARAQGAAHDAQQVRLAAWQAALAAVKGRVAATPLDGTWDLSMQPGGTGLLDLTQVGTLVTGSYVMADRSAGSVTGTFAGGRLRLERVDAVQGRDAVFEGILAGTQVQGTWLATIFGRGLPESGAWIARRRPVIPLAEAAPETPPETTD